MNAISEDRVLIVEEPDGRGVPVIDGWSLAALLRDMGGEQIRLVAVTSRDEPEERERSRAAGFDAQWWGSCRPTK